MGESITWDEAAEICARNRREKPSAASAGYDRSKYDCLYAATNRLMVILGAVGTVDSQHDAVTAVMDALYDIDGGTPPRS